MPDNEDEQSTRREFLKQALSTVAVSGVVAGCAPPSVDKIPPPTDAQLQWRKKGKSVVSIIKAESYEENIFELLKKTAIESNLPDLKNKKVVLKVNMVEFRTHVPIFTNPAVVAAAAKLADYLGAREIVIAEGAGHMRDTDFLLEATGIGAVVKKLGVSFVDLNLDDLVKVENPGGFSKLASIYLPANIVNADIVVSLPKLKTHHWVGVTASMKNFFGAVPGRMYGWPKNILHWHGITQCIIDLNHIIRPAFAIVDGITAMEGDGPVNGTAKQANVVLIGTDLPAVDATGARIMKVDPQEIPYLKLAEQVLGNVDVQDIEIKGIPIAEVAQQFVLPACLTKDKFQNAAKDQAS